MLTTQLSAGPERPSFSVSAQPQPQTHPLDRFATTYEFSLNNSFTQSDIVAEVGFTTSKMYFSYFKDLEEGETKVVREPSAQSQRDAAVDGWCDTKHSAKTDRR
jgi:hypothetical protein